MVFGNKKINRNIIYLHFYEVFCEKYFVIIYNLYINVFKLHDLFSFESSSSIRHFLVVSLQS